MTLINNPAKLPSLRDKLANLSDVPADTPTEQKVEKKKNKKKK